MGIKLDEEKEKRKLAGLGKKYSDDRIKKSSLGLKGKTPWNKGLTKESDIRVKKNHENVNRPTYLKTYVLITPTNEKIIFNGRNNLKKYIKEINKNLKRNTKINVDKLINDKQFGNYSLK